MREIYSRLDCWSMSTRFVYKITTPMFLGGADQEAGEVRAASFKGALRFWWRALAWRRVAEGENPLQDLRAREIRLFGAAARQTTENEPVHGQSAVLISAAMSDSEGDRTEQIRTIGKGVELRGAGTGATYLGYGVMDYKRKTARSALQHNQHITLTLTFRRRGRRPTILTEQERQEILDAARLLGLLGGLGSRSRRGYGSLSLVRVIHEDGTSQPGPKTPDEYATSLQALIGNTAEQTTLLPDYSAFFGPASDQHGAHIQILRPSQALKTACNANSSADPWQVLNQLGSAFVLYRANGRSGQVNVGSGLIDAMGPFESDHDWFKGDTPLDGYAPRRALFGLPHNYFSPRRGPQPAVKGFVEHEVPGQARRASPLMFHIHEFDGRLLPVVVILPSRFLPGTGTVRARTTAQPGHTDVPVAEDWSLLFDFISYRHDDRRRPFALFTPKADDIILDGRPTPQEANGDE